MALRPSRLGRLVAVLLGSAFLIGAAWRLLGFKPSEPDLKAWLATWAVADESAGLESSTGLPLRVTRSVDKAPMRLLPAGVFTMGRAKGEDEQERIALSLGKRWHPSTRDKPAHRVRVSRAFYIDETEATMKTLAMGEGYLLPASSVLWREAKQYAVWVGGDLPTEAEWEYAARGGMSGEVYPWGNTDNPKYRNGLGDSDGHVGLAPIASYPANGFGLFDMVGNVAEWCADSGLRDYTSAAEPLVDPVGVDAGELHVIRGGAFSSDDITLRTSERLLFDEERLESFGFRVVIRVPGSRAEAPSE